MRKIIILMVFVFPLLWMKPCREKEQRKVVENYLTTLLNTEDENIEQVLSLFKISNKYTKEDLAIFSNALLEIKHYLQGNSYKIMNYRQAKRFVKKTDYDVTPSDVGNTYHIYNVTKNEIIWLAPVVVNDNCEIISFALGICDDNPQHLCFVYL